MNPDLIIVGGGAGGLGAARAARWAGADVVLVNDGPLGGDCTFTGCVPSKTLLAAARAGLDHDAALARVHDTVARIAATETAEVLRAEGVTVLEGRGRFVGPDTVVVGDRRVRSDRIVVATGARPAMPPIPGLDAVEPLTTEEIFELRAKPRRLAVIGGGPVGCELAQAFAGLDVRVTLLEGRERLLPREEPQASAVVEAALVAAGVRVHTGATITRVAGGPGATVLHTADRDIEVDRVLVATGRVPNSTGFGLEELGVALDAAGHIRTDDRLRTTVDGIYAVGDVTGVLPFTHAADEMGRLAAGNALGTGLRGRFRPHLVPWATFTDPEVARIGMTEAEAARHGGRVAELPLTEMDRAVTDGRTDGFIVLIAGPRRVLRHAFGGQMLGATIVAPRAGEMIHEIALAMRTRMFTGRLAQTTHAYPTWSYGIQKAAAQFFGEVEGRRARPARRP